MGEPRRRWRLFSPLSILAVLVLYVLSLGPACWLELRSGFRHGPWLNVIYRPLLWGWEYCPQPAHNWITVYVNFGTDSQYVMIPYKGQLNYYDRGRGFSVFRLATGL